jgi:hypothetical protein
MPTDACLCSHVKHFYGGKCLTAGCGCLQFEIGPSSGVPSVYLRVAEKLLDAMRRNAVRRTVPGDPALERAKASAELVEHVPAGSVPTGDAR